MRYGTFLCKKWKKPFIPIHHMEAHALTARMVDEVKLWLVPNILSVHTLIDGLNFQKVRFPFLVLLISGGHCLLALVEGVDSFLLLGKSMDIAPGEVFDKVYIFHTML